MDLSPFLSILGRIEAKVEAILKGPKPETVTLTQAMDMTGDKSPPAFYRTCAALGITRFKRGHYRRVDIENAMGRRTLLNAAEAKRRLQSAKDDELLSEGRHRQPKPNPHCD